MPIYEYRCSKCGTDFELIRSMSEMDKPASCPKCRAKADKLISTHASKVDFHLKVPRESIFRQSSRMTGIPSARRIGGACIGRSRISCRSN